MDPADIGRLWKDLEARHEQRLVETVPWSEQQPVFAELDRLGYRGFVGCEYNPAGGTEAGLGWFAPYRASQGRDGTRCVSPSDIADTLT